MRHEIGRFTLIAILAVALAGTSALGQQGSDQRQSFAGQLVEDGVVSTSDNEFGPAFTPDGKTLFFCKTDPARSRFQMIVVTHLRNGKWSEPEVAPFSGRYKDIDPSMAPDGSRIVFASNRPVSGSDANSYDLWMVERTERGWSEPKHLGPKINSAESESTSSIAADGTLYFASDRKEGKGRRDLYRSRLVDGAYADPEPLDALNTEHDDSNQVVAPDQSFIIFASNRPGGFGESDFYVSYQRDGAWTAPENLGSAINDASAVLTPAISPDGAWLYFASFRGFADDLDGKALSHEEFAKLTRRSRNGLGDLYRIELSRLPIKR